MTESAVVTEAGLYELSAADYHADPCEEPSLNNSTIPHLLACPRLAWQQHPRLNPGYEPAQSNRLDLGDVAHQLLLGAGRGIVELPFSDYRTKDAQKARDEARAAGKTPILTEQLAQANGMVGSLHAQLAEYPEKEVARYFDPEQGQSEIGLFWFDEAGAWGRSLIDRLLTEGEWIVLDYKSVGRSADPAGLGLSIHAVDQGYDTQFAMIERGLTRLHSTLAGRIKFRWVFQEIDPPFLVSVVEPDAATMTIARKKVEYAFAKWADCLRNDDWPGYPQEIVPLRHADHLATRWLEREIAEADEARDRTIKLKRNPGRPSRPTTLPYTARGKRILTPRLPPDQTIIDAG